MGAVRSARSTPPGSPSIPNRLVPTALAALLLGAAALAPSPAAAQDPRAADTAKQDTLEKADGANGDGFPLDPARRLQCTTSEGSWMSPDVAPSDKSLVFDLMGDLDLLPI